MQFRSAFSEPSSFGAEQPAATSTSVDRINFPYVIETPEIFGDHASYAGISSNSKVLRKYCLLMFSTVGNWVA